jgi:serine/threonine protein phosphatase PrpC
MLTADTRTHPGGRPTNEDCVLWDPDLALMAIADGMGGHNAGEVASRVALETARAFLRDTASASDDLATTVSWAFGINPGLSITANRLLNAVKLANREIFRAAQEHVEYNGMGTTLVMAIEHDGHLTYVSVGDSRLYTLVGSELRQLTRDDSWVALISAETGVDANMLKKHPMQHVLTSVVGARVDLDVTVQELDLRDGQTLMMCTDGVHGTLSDTSIQKTLQGQQDLNLAAERLIQEALDHQARDNVTVLVARYKAQASA